MAHPARRYIAYVRFQTGKLQTLVTASMAEINRRGGQVVAWVPLPQVSVQRLEKWPR